MTDAFRRAYGPLAVLAILGVAIVLPAEERLNLALPDSSAAQGFVGVLDAVPDGSTVLVGFDPDLGTYAEIRPTVRAALGSLVARGVEIAVISLTPEGRALAVEESASLVDEGGDPAQLVDLGFVPGAEAALVRIADALTGAAQPDAPTAVATLGRIDLVLVVGGNDIGPRSWVEQVETRVGSIPYAAISPTILLPEVAPYVGTEQLAASIANPREGAALRAMLDGTSPDSADGGPPAAAVLAGLLIAIVLLGEGLMRRLVRAVASRPEREALP